MNLSGNGGHPGFLIDKEKHKTCFSYQGGIPSHMQFWRRKSFLNLNKSEKLALKQLC